MYMVSETDADAATMQSDSNVNPTYASGCYCKIIEYAFIGRRTQEPPYPSSITKGLRTCAVYRRRLRHYQAFGQPDLLRPSFEPTDLGWLIFDGSKDLTLWVYVKIDTKMTTKLSTSRTRSASVLLPHFRN